MMIDVTMMMIFDFNMNDVYSIREMQYIWVMISLMMVFVLFVD